MPLFGPNELERELTDQIIALRADIAKLKVIREAETTESKRTAKVIALEEEISKLKVERSQIEEEYERQEREVRHEVGLLRKQVEAESQIAKQEAVLEVREENLTADRERFETQMKFTTERFEKETVYLREIMTEIMKRLPTIEVDLSRRISEGPALANGHADPD